MNLPDIEILLEKKIRSGSVGDDPAHDLLHFRRVVAMAKRLATAEGASLEVVVPAAWLHDLVNVPKNDPRRAKASRLSAMSALQYLSEIGYPQEHFDGIAHAISAHSYSAAIETRTLEAQVVQDADRLDGLGAIGIARCFVVAGLLKRQLYSESDPFCEDRAPDDGEFTIDHFYAKLFKTAESLKTATGREIGLRRVETMQKYLTDLRSEISIL